MIGRDDRGQTIEHYQEIIIYEEVIKPSSLQSFSTKSSVKSMSSGYINLIAL